jgi:chromatin segregation and condensation protein Rec8/ScpA/Scc1 (kleisin family)
MRRAPIIAWSDPAGQTREKELLERVVVGTAPSADVMVRAEMFAHLHVQREQLSVRQRMSEVLDALRTQAFVEFTHLFRPSEGRMGVAVTFTALLELLREGLIEIVQSDAYGPIHVRAGAPRHITLVIDNDRSDQGNEIEP